MKGIILSIDDKGSVSHEMVGNPSQVEILGALHYASTLAEREGIVAILKEVDQLREGLISIGKELGQWSKESSSESSPSSDSSSSSESSPDSSED